MPTNSLILVPALPPDFKIEAIPAIATTKAKLLATKEITSIATLKERDDVIKKSSLIATHLKAFESEREKIKAPFYKICTDIDRVAREHRAELEEEKKRLDRLIGAYEQEEQRKRDDEARKLREQAAAAEAEAERKRREAAAAAAKPAKSPAAALSAELDAENAEIAAADARRIEEEKQMTLAEEGRKQAAKGGANRFEIEVEVTDIKALYAAYPLCVKLTPDLPMIKGLYQRGVELPGVTINKRPIFSTRSK